MKVLAIVGVAAACVSTASPSRHDLPAVTQALTEREHAWAAAYLRHDVAAIGAILTDDFVGIDGRGVVTDRAGELRDSAAPAPGAPEPDFVILDDRIEDIRVRAYGDIAVLTAISNERIRFKGEESRVRYRRTTVWRFDNAGWRCVSFHGSRIAE